MQISDHRIGTLVARHAARAETESKSDILPPRRKFSEVYEEDWDVCPRDEPAGFDAQNDFKILNQLGAPVASAASAEDLQGEIGLTMCCHNGAAVQSTARWSVSQTMINAKWQLHFMPVWS